MGLIFLEIKEFKKPNGNFEILVLADKDKYERYEIFINPFMIIDNLKRGDSVKIEYGLSNYKGRTNAQVEKVLKL